MACYLITGGCGFIGSHLADHLAGQGHRIRILDDLSTGRRDQCHPAADLMVGSVTDPDMVRAAMADMDGCFHLAAVASVPQCNREIVVCHRTNITGFLLLLEAARRTGRRIPFVYASSAAVYGDRQHVVSEQTCARPISHYGCDKFACELHAWSAQESAGLSSIGLRFFNVYGPRQQPDSAYSGVISIFMDQLRKDRVLHIFGDGEQVRDFVFVGDVARALSAAMCHLEAAYSTSESTASVYNICTGSGTTINELADAVQQVCGRRIDVTHGTPRAADIRVSLGCNQAAATNLGFIAEIELYRGLRALHESLTNAGQAVRDDAM